MNNKNESNPKKTKICRQKHGRRTVEFEGAFQCKCPIEIYRLAQAPSNSIDQTLDENRTLQEGEFLSQLTAVAPLQHPETRSSSSSSSSTLQACADRTGRQDYDLAEPDMLCALERAAMKMIEGAKKQQRGRGVELETVKQELKTVEEELRLSQEHGTSVEQSRDKVLEDLSDKIELLRTTQLTSKIYEVECKAGAWRGRAPPPSHPCREPQVPAGEAEGRATPPSRGDWCKGGAQDGQVAKRRISF